MTCVPADPKFRLLDNLVGWDPIDALNPTHIVGFDDPDGIRLAGGGPDGVSPDALDPYIPPPRLAPGCGRCDWVLVTPPAPISAVLALDGCSNTWHSLWPYLPVTFGDAVAVAVDRHRVAIADRAADRVWVFHLPGGQLLGEIAVDAPRDLSFGSSGEIVVAAEDGRALLRFTFNGRRLGPWPADLPDALIARVAHDREGRLWLATEAGRDHYALLAQDTACDPVFHLKTETDLSTAFPKTAALRSGAQGFCITRGLGDGTEGPVCWSWFGRPVDPGCVAAAAGGAFAHQGQLLTEPIDSGIPRCRWHRVRIEADIPAGTRIALAVATGEAPDAQPKGVQAGAWVGFDAGVPHPGDWQEFDSGLTDVLIDRPAGRYLFLRLRLSGDGSATPMVRRVHIDFPRATSANQLPGVFREDPDAADFTERFLSLFDATLGTVDEAVTRLPALIKGADARAEALPWIASFLSVTLDPTWDTETRRRILDAAPELFRLRGTRDGLTRSIRLAFGLEEDPAITEHGLERNWGAVAGSGSLGQTDARLGATRLFSRRTARMTLGQSPVGTTKIMSFGTPASDPHAVGAFRFSVSLPPNVAATSEEGALAALTRLIEGQKPAHTQSTARIARRAGFRIGGDTLIGIDTVLGRPEPVSLGTPAARLSCNAILGGEPPPGPVLGRTSRVTRPSKDQPAISCPECTP